MDRTGAAPAGELTTLGAREIARLVASRALSAREAIETHLRRIEVVDDRVRAFVVRRFDEARAEAELADRHQARGEPLGPLHGVPITLKESFDLAGTSSTAGLPARAAHRAEADAPLVARLRRAGAIVLGKTNVSQLLVYIESANPLYGPTNNPWDLTRTPGGSSGGEAAAIASGAAPLGLATDIGGSLRIPAHFCGIAGIKATSGRFGLAGTVNVHFMQGQEAVLDAVGPLARRVEDLALALTLLAAPGDEGREPALPPVPLLDPAAIDVARLVIGVYDDDRFFRPAPALRRAVREAAAALEARGARVVEFPPPGVDEAIELYYRLLTADGATWAPRLLGDGPRDPHVRDLLRLVGLPGIARPLLARLARARGQRQLARLVAATGALSADRYWQAIAARTRLRARFLAAMDAGRLDALLCPPNALPAIPHGASRALLAAAVCYTALFNLLGLPAGVVPATRVRPGEESDRPVTADRVDRAAKAAETGTAGLPVGVQVAARHWREDVVLAVMAALEAHFRGQPDYPARPPI